MVSCGGGHSLFSRTWLMECGHLLIFPVSWLVGHHTGARSAAFLKQLSSPCLCLDIWALITHVCPQWRANHLWFWAGLLNWVFKSGTPDMGYASYSSLFSPRGSAVMLSGGHREGCPWWLLISILFWPSAYKPGKNLLKVLLFFFNPLTWNGIFRTDSSW